MFRRMWVVTILITAWMLIYIGRLAWLQLIPPNVSSTSSAVPITQASWQRVALQQRQRQLVLDTGRGDFYDRFGKPITGETYMAAAFFDVPAVYRGQADAQMKLAKLLNVNETQLTQWWDALREPTFWSNTGTSIPLRLTQAQVSEMARLKVKGVKVLPYHNRYGHAFAAKHAIGFISQHPEWLRAHRADDLQTGKLKVSDQIGGSGLEKSLDSILHGLGATSVSYMVDGRNAPLEGLDLRIAKPVSRYYPLQAMTTIDLELQNRIEAILDSEGIAEGAVVVLDPETADIVAMVSRPDMKPGAFQRSDGREWANHAIIATTPGSIFKLVTEAAALESGAANLEEIFTCNGEYGRYGLSCWKEGGHGTLTLEEGLAQSCNIVFADIAERLQPSELLWTAEALGLANPIGWHRSQPFGPFRSSLRLLEEEEAGRVFAETAAHLGNESGWKHAYEGRDGNGSARASGSMEARARQLERVLLREKMLQAVDGGILAQSGIGQRDVRMSPLQAANLIVTLLNEGRVMEPRLVSEIRYADGQRMLKLPAQRAQGLPGRIRPGTAHALLRGMEAVVDHGTGRSIRQGLWAVAGKSGTAEVTRAGIDRNHQWFAGYGPVARPRYAVAVLVENQSPGSSNRATKLFRRIMDMAAKLENERTAD